MSSDKLGSIHQPVLSLDLDVSEDGERRRENLELSKEELAKMIGSLEAANKVRVVVWNVSLISSQPSFLDVF